MNHRVLVAAACVALFCLPTMAQEEQREATRVGVMPVAVPLRASSEQRGTAERYTRALTEALAEHRPDVITLGIPGDPAPAPRHHRERRELARAEARRMNVGQVVSAWLQTNRRGERVSVELLDERGRVVMSVKVRPQRDLKSWSRSVAKRLRPHLSPAARPRRAPTPTPPATASSASPTTSADLPSSLEVSSPADAGLGDDPRVAEVDPGSDDDNGSALPWVLGVTGAGLVTAGVVAVSVGGLYGALAFDESTRLVRRPARDPERLAMEKSSMEKAIMADVLFAAATVFVLAGGTAVAAALLPAE